MEKRSAASAKADALSWTNQQNLRIVLEQITSELLTEQPDDPLMKMLDILERRSAPDRDTQASGSSSSALQPSGRRGAPPNAAASSADEAEKLRAECEKWKRLAAEQEAIAQRLEERIAALEGADHPPE